MERSGRDLTDRPGASPSPGAERAKGRSVVIPLDDEAALRALAAFSYSGEGDADAPGAVARTERE